MSEIYEQPKWCTINKKCGWFGCQASTCRDLKCKYYKPVLDEYWKQFIDATNERFKQCGKQ